jgi:hypothetical protein
MVEKQKQNRWMISYADVFTLLFAAAVLAFVYQSCR